MTTAIAFDGDGDDDDADVNENTMYPIVLFVFNVHMAV